MNDSRTLVRQLLLIAGETAYAGPETSSSIQKLSYRQIGFCYALGQSLRGEDAFAATQPFLSEGEQQLIKGQSNVPNALLLLHNQTLKELFDSKKINSYDVFRKLPKCKFF